MALISGLIEKDGVLLQPLQAPPIRRDRATPYR
jgi:hypothetical protein